MGVGRPDVAGSTDMGVVDLNHADVVALRRLPGVDAATAAQIVATRERVRGFSSVERRSHPPTVMDLDGDLVGGLHDHVVCLPWAGAA